MTTTAETKMRHHARRAPQPGPWTVEKQGEDWAVLDANGFWVCNVGKDELDARHIAACDPQSVIAVLDRVDVGEQERTDASGDVVAEHEAHERTRDYLASARQQLAEAQSEVEQLKRALADSPAMAEFMREVPGALRLHTAETDGLRAQLTAMTAARDELVTLALDERWTSRDPSIREAMKVRISDLSKVGAK